MKIEKKYHHCSAADLLKDEKFLCWILNPDEESNKFWVEQQNEHPALKDSIDAAIRAFHTMKINRPGLSDEEKTNMLSNIYLKYKKNRTMRKMYFYAASVACLLLVVGFSFWMNQSYLRQHSLSGMEASIPTMPSSVDFNQLKDVELIFNGQKKIITGKGNVDVSLGANSVLSVKEGRSNYRSKLDDHSNNYTCLLVPYGKRSSLSLPDGTKMWINSGTEIRFANSMSGKERQVFVDGEIYIEVAHNPKRPFYVRTSDMKRILTFVVACMLSIGIFADDVSTFKGLVSRLLPNLSSSIIAKKLPSGSEDYFQISSQDGKIEIAGNNANSMAVGLNYYLKYYCHTTVSWYVDDHFDMPTSLPAIEKPVTVNARCKNRFFLNYCTFGYTMPWWNWKDWEHFIDWMALNGVNLPLAITGQESVWHKVWMKLGLKDKEIRHYFTGPAHLPWHRMLNIDYWQGDLPMSWLDDQEELQKKIVAREREFNMRPVLPAFAGHVPQELKQIYPKAKITKLGAWSGYSDQYACSFLDPMDPLFTKIQKLFLQQQKAIYGTDHIYGIDLFNELAPPSYEASYLKRVANQVYGSLAKADKNAIWLQMTWLFYDDGKACFSLPFGLPKEKEYPMKRPLPYHLQQLETILNWPLL